MPCPLPISPLQGGDLEVLPGVCQGGPRGSQNQLQTTEAPTAGSESSPPAPFCSQKHRGSRGQSLPPPVSSVVPEQALSPQEVCPRLVSATAEKRGLHTGRGGSEEPEKTQWTILTLPPVPTSARAGCSCSVAPRGMRVEGDHACESTSQMQITASEDIPTPRLSSEPSSFTEGRGLWSGQAPGSGPSKDTGKGLTLSAYFPLTNHEASDPSAVREELERGQVTISPFLLRPPWSRPWTAGKIWRACRGCCRNTRSWNRKWASFRPRWRCATGCGGGPRPGYFLCGTLCRGQQGFRTLRASQIHSAVISTDWGPPAAGDPT